MSPSHRTGGPFWRPMALRVSPTRDTIALLTGFQLCDFGIAPWSPPPFRFRQAMSEGLGSIAPLPIPHSRFVGWCTGNIAPGSRRRIWAGVGYRWHWRLSRFQAMFAWFASQVRRRRMPGCRPSVFSTSQPFSRARSIATASLVRSSPSREYESSASNSVRRSCWHLSCGQWVLCSVRAELLQAERYTAEVRRLVQGGDDEAWKCSGQIIISGNVSLWLGKFMDAQTYLESAHS